MNHRVGRSIFALLIGLVVAYFSYQWISNPQSREQRAAEEAAVLASRALLVELVAVDNLEIVDPLSPNRKIGKAYIYAEPPGWAVSGYYSRDEEDRWHPFLASMTEDLDLVLLKVQDNALQGRADSEPKLLVTP